MILEVPNLILNRYHLKRVNYPQLGDITPKQKILKSIFPNLLQSLYPIKNDELFPAIIYP